MAFVFNDSILLSKCQNSSFAADVKTFIFTREYFGLLTQFNEHGLVFFCLLIESGGKLKVTLGNQSVELQLGVDIYKSMRDKLNTLSK